jgi:hypothetical protein
MEIPIVDYFSHQFDSLDLHTNWKTQTKLNTFESTRLENVLWRRYNQERFQVPKVNPLTLNWSKDFCWLYGPILCGEQEASRCEVKVRFKRNQAVRRLDLLVA